MSRLPPFDGNDYRKRVLAAVLKRGGPETSDPFELYDLPLDAAAEGGLADADVAERVQEVWGFWQRQRDHPRYRSLVEALVAEHAERSTEILDGYRRVKAAEAALRRREQRDASRYELLDAAIERLVQRHGGIRRDKVAGLEEVGAQAGLTAAEVAARLRRYRMIDPPAPGPVVGTVVGDERRRQIRALLDEFGRLTDGPAAPTLLVLLGLEPSSPQDTVHDVARAWRQKARELPPQRLRAVVDELLVHVADLLESGPEGVDAYLDAVAEDVVEALRPRVRAAVLVEDVLVAEDHAHLVAEAVAQGLDERRAVAVLARIVAELGTSIEPSGRSSGPSPSSPPPAAAAPHRSRAWEEPLRAARSALRGGRAIEAEQLVERARALAGAEGATTVRAMADEVAAVLAEARRRLQGATADRAARRWVGAVEHLEQVERTARDLPGAEQVAEWLADARRRVADADARVVTALGADGPDRVRLLRQVLEECADHPGATAALAEIPVPAPAWVTAARDARGDVVVIWADVGVPDVTYRVRRQRPDGSWHVLGRFTGLSAEDGGAPAGVDAPVYDVAASQAGRVSAGTRSDGPVGAPAAAPEPVPSVRAPGPVRTRRRADGAVEVTWRGVGDDVEYRVRCAHPDGRWRVVGRTRVTTMEDGGAPPGEVPVYAVSAAVGGLRSDEALSG